MKVSYTVIIERGENGYGAFVPDLPGCVAVGDTEEEVTNLIREAIQFHIEGLLRDGEPVPPAMARSIEVKTDVAA
jgi:predicted RNase H-like HicB family nuclease